MWVPDQCAEPLQTQPLAYRPFGLADAPSLRSGSGPPGVRTSGHMSTTHTSSPQRKPGYSGAPNIRALAVSAVDVSMLTGESVPVEVTGGDEVAGATINASGRLDVRATRVGADTALAQIARLVAGAQAGKAQVQRLADRVSGVFVPMVIALSVLTLAEWLLSGASAAAAFSASVAVLIIACPCALGLATPTALMVGSGRGAQLGILIRGPETLERTRQVTTIVLDKTGTVTEGRMQVASLIAANGVAEDEMLRLAASVEEASEHPIGGRSPSTAASSLGRCPPSRNSAAAHASASVRSSMATTSSSAAPSFWLSGTSIYRSS